jgi:hypothetical protein
LRAIESPWHPREEVGVDAVTGFFAHIAAELCSSIMLETKYWNKKPRNTLTKNYDRIKIMNWIYSGR